MLKEQVQRPLCKCGKPCKQNGISKLGFVKYYKVCSQCDKKKYGYVRKEPVAPNHRQRGPAYRKHKQQCCVLCGFVAVHPCQLDVDHIDGNHSNDDPVNLQTLCANCHRLKTWQQNHSHKYNTPDQL